MCLRAQVYHDDYDEEELEAEEAKDEQESELGFHVSARAVLVVGVTGGLSGGFCRGHPSLGCSDRTACSAVYGPCAGEYM